MSKTQEKPPLEVPEEKDDRKSVIKKVARILHDELGKFADELEEFEQKREEVRKRIKNGARRTTSRTV